MYIEPWVFWVGVIFLALWISGVNKWTADCAKDIENMQTAIDDLYKKHNSNRELIAKIVDSAKEADNILADEIEKINDHIDKE